MDTILIVEDDRSLAEGLARALTSQQTQAQSCPSIQDAERLLANAAYDLVILDVNLPDGSGFDFLKTVKKNYGCSVILLTANDLESDIVTGLEQGADIEVNKDEYVVFRIVSSRGDGYGDGNAQLVRYYLDVNYYYAYEKTDSRFIGANERIEATMSAFLADPRFHIANGQSDIYDLDNPYRGINIEFLFVGVNDR